MNLRIQTHAPATLSLPEAMQALRVQQDYEGEFRDIFDRCAEIARPKYCFAEMEASAQADCTCIGGMRFDSRILRINMQGLERAFPSIITCGREIYEFSRSLNDMLEQFWVDGIAEMLMLRAGELMRREIERIAGGQIRSMSPGSLGDFPLIEQEKLFHLLGEGPRSIGVELTDRCLMIPHKSASAIYFASDAEYENCMLCLREGCSHRRAAFSETAFMDRYALTGDDVRQRPGR